ncbi:hypothetical protein A2733_01250 [Candidatus Nomurabacteria bacterium RIFCSPHIGHO2_01_FULL_40_20]|uniref:Inositol-1-monophosphatase n=1 Tax=Candidatus Nomurabacteria bacterium RIFCSPHIGHO2_01_FULL_40_20 TaxID=1801738 RepID=A0A1F6V462_9BACT|nr:MAG: hypothetical protein A2733_01250 [Candidatus Nomurabacteria bacterium RIFCSPHIGHO2_01_FULL_40_20]
MTKEDKKNLIKATHAGGKILKKYFGKTLNLVEKSMIADFKTEADTESEKTILRILKKEFKNYNIHSEENGKINKSSKYTIVIDPLDGTNNFVLGIPNFSITIAVLFEGEAIAGVIHQPILKQTYFAEKGKGAFLNNKKIKVNNNKDPKALTIAYSCGYKTSHTRIANIIRSLVVSKFYKRVTFNWSPAYDHCLLASGKIEALITDAGTEIYDFGAGKLIAKEAGAKIYTLDGKKDTDFLNDAFIIGNSEKVIKNVLKRIPNR